MKQEATKKHKHGFRIFFFSATQVTTKPSFCSHLLTNLLTFHVICYTFNTCLIISLILCAYEVTFNNLTISLSFLKTFFWCRFHPGYHGNDSEKSRRSKKINKINRIGGNDGTTAGKLGPVLNFNF